MASVSLTDIYPEVRPDVPGCIDAVMLNAIRRAAIELCSESRFWEIDIDPITIIAGVTDYEIYQPLNQRVVRLESAIGQFGNIPFKSDRDIEQEHGHRWREHQGAVPMGLIMLAPRLMRIYPTPNTTGAQIALRASMKPAPTATVIDDYVYDDYYTAIAARAKAILCAMPGKEWTDLQMVPFYQKIFEDAVDRAKVIRARMYSNAAIRSTPGNVGIRRR